MPQPSATEIPWLRPVTRGVTIAPVVASGAGTDRPGAIGNGRESASATTVRRASDVTDRATCRPSGSVILLQPPKALELAVALALLVAVDADLLDRLARRGLIVLAPLLGVAEDLFEVLGA